MRKILLSDDGVHFRADALYRVQATAFFPDSPRDIEQTVAISMMELEDYRTNGRENHKPSKLSEAIGNMFLKKYAGASICGAVAIVMCHNLTIGKRASLNGAAQLVSEFAYSVGKMSVPTFEQYGETAVRKIAIPADLADVKKYFRRFQSSAHILAALTTITEYEVNKPIFETTQLELSRLVQSAAYFQSILSKMPDASRWNLIDVSSSIPECARYAEPYLPTQAQLADFFKS